MSGAHPQALLPGRRLQGLIPKRDDSLQYRDVPALPELLHLMCRGVRAGQPMAAASARSPGLPCQRALHRALPIAAIREQTVLLRGICLPLQQIRRVHGHCMAGAQG
jgi:hypothetical protein